MTHSRNTIRDDIDYEAVRSSCKLLLVALMALFMLYLVSILPGVDRVVPSAYSLLAIAMAIIAVAIAGLLLYMAPGFATLVRRILDGPEEIVENVATIFQLLVALTAMLVAHRGIAPSIELLFDDALFVYDLLFMALILPILLVIAMRMYVSIDPFADLLASKVVTDSPDGEESQDADPDR